MFLVTLFLQLHLDTKGWLCGLKHRWVHRNVVLCRELEKTWDSVVWILLPWQQHLLWVLCKCCWCVNVSTQLGYLEKLSYFPLVGSEWPVSINWLWKPVDETVGQQLAPTQGFLWVKHLFALRLLLVVKIWCKQFWFCPTESVQEELSNGNNVLYWRTTTYSLHSSAVKPVLLRNIQVSGTTKLWNC